MFRDNMIDFRDVVLKGERLYVGEFFFVLLDFFERERTAVVDFINSPLLLLYMYILALKSSFIFSVRGAISKKYDYAVNYK